MSVDGAARALDPTGTSGNDSAAAAGFLPLDTRSELLARSGWARAAGFRSLDSSNESASGNDSAHAAGSLPLDSRSELRAMNRASPRDLELISTSGHGWARAAGFRNLDPSNESASGNESAHAAGFLPLDRSVR